MKNSISVSLVMYQNDISELTTAIECTLKSDLIGKIYLIDNSSSNELKVLQKLSEKIEYLFQNSNLGFGKAHNLGIELAKKEGFKFHLILNPDVEYQENVLSVLHSYMIQNEKCGLVMPKIYYKNGDLQYLCKKLPTPFEMFGKRIPIKSFQKRINYKLELHQFDYNSIQNIPYLSGCFMFCRMSALDKVKGFDNRYFMYMEDLDITRSIHKDYETIYNPNTSIIHGYRSESKVNLKLLIVLIVSAIKYFNKYGWFFDKERKKINQNLFNQLHKLKNNDN